MFLSRWVGGGLGFIYGLCWGFVFVDFVLGLVYSYEFK